MNDDGFLQALLSLLHRPPARRCPAVTRRVGAGPGRVDAVNACITLGRGDEPDDGMTTGSGQPIYSRVNQDVRGDDANWPHDFRER